MAQTPKVSFKEINKIAIPAIIAGIAEPLISLTDIAVIGNVEENSVEALAAAGIVGSFLSTIIWIVAQTKTAISAIVSQHLGANRVHAVKTLIPQAIVFNLILSLVIYATTAFFAESIFSAYNADGLILKYTEDYYTTRITQNDFATALLILSGAVMKADGKVLKAELEYVKQFFSQQFPPQHSKQYIKQFRDILLKAK